VTKSSLDLIPLAEETASLLKALSHPVRLMICCQLRDGEMAVGEIEETLGVRQPRLSRELAKLREDGLVVARRQSKAVFYGLADEGRVAAVIDAICGAVLGDGRPAAQPGGATGPRPNQAGGYGVFARAGADA